MATSMSNRQSNATPVSLPSTITDTLAPTRGHEDSRNHYSADDDASRLCNVQTAHTVIPPGDRDRKSLHPFPHPVFSPHVTFLHCSRKRLGRRKPLLAGQTV